MFPLSNVNAPSTVRCFVNAPPRLWLAEADLVWKQSISSFVAPKQPGHLITIPSIRPYQEDYQWKRKQSFTKQTGPPPPCNRHREACRHPGEVLVDCCAKAMQNCLAHRARMALRERDTQQHSLPWAASSRVLRPCD